MRAPLFRRASRWRVFVLSWALIAALASPAFAWIDDQNGNRIDDRIERADQMGWNAVFENSDPAKRMVIGAFNGVPVQYAIYVGYDHHPTPADELALAGLGLTSLKTYEYIDYTRTAASFAQIQQIAALPGVTRVEAVPMMYPSNHMGSRLVRARDSRGIGADQNYVLFPSARQELGLDGTGVVIAILDTGVNDEPDDVNPTYPGHESLVGKGLGGGEFYSGQPLLNTGLDESLNPKDRGDFHGTHVAGSALGHGGNGGFFAGVAPAARLVDCKVLSDAGAGFGSADGVEWCIHNKDKLWPSLAGADTVYRGIDVLSLSLGGLTNSDGTDAGSQMMNAAVNAGLVVCIATGNDDSTSYIASPAAADLVIAVGATTHGGTLDRSDDRVTGFSNEGPRLDDGDGDKLDEMKPSVVGPGAGIVSANGDWSTTGTGYSTKSGTSMSTPHVSGVAALMLQANPNLTPLQVRSIMQNTAEHDIPSEKGNRPNDPFGVDPNYAPESGWGLVDSYAACLEAINSATGVQVTQIRPVARPNDLEIDVHWITQREFAFQGFNVYRAIDANGSPSTFSKINGSLIPPSVDGDPALAGDDNRTPYVYVDADPGLVLGTRYWYQVEWIDSGSGSNLEPPAPADFGEPKAVASIRYSIAHNAVDNDIFVRLGMDQDYSIGSVGEPEFEMIGPGESDVDSVVLVTEPANTASSTVGNAILYWSVDLTQADNVASFFPPDTWHPWFLYVEDGGFINRTGRVESFSIMVWDSAGATTGTEYFTDHVPMPQPTGEFGLNPALLWIPEQGTVSVADETSRLTFAMPSRPNPVSGRATFEYAVGADVAVDGGAPVRLKLYDTQGRLVRTLRDRNEAPGRYRVEWNGTDRHGMRVAPGIYMMRFEAGAARQTVRVAVIQ